MIANKKQKLALVVMGAVALNAVAAVDLKGKLA